MPPRGPIGTGVPVDFDHDRVPIFGVSAGGPTVYNQSISGSLSFAGSAPLFSMQRPLTGALSFAGAAPLAAITRSLTGAVLQPAGALFKRTSRSLVGATFHPTAAFTPVRNFARTLTAAALNFVGGNALYPDPTQYPNPALYPYYGSLLIQRPFHLAASVFAPVGGAQLYPDDALFPLDSEFPFGGAILFQLNRVLPGALSFSGSFATQGGLVRVLTAVFQPHTVFLKTSARVFLAAAFSSAGFAAVRASHTVAQALFASLRNAGSLHTITNPGRLDQGGGGFGVPMPDSFFQRYQPTLRRQKTRV